MMIDFLDSRQQASRNRPKKRSSGMEVDGGQRER
jgi:hypothetical protein